MALRLIGLMIATTAFIGLGSFVQGVLVPTESSPWRSTVNISRQKLCATQARSLWRADPMGMWRLDKVLREYSSCDFLFLKGSARPRRRRRRGSGKASRAPAEVFASDEHRLGLKPVKRRVWAPVGERPIAPGHHRFDWRYVTAFVSPASGETFWYVRDGVSKPFFSALLENFAREAGAGVGRTIVLVLDNAGWHGEAGLNVPSGVRWSSCRPTRPNYNRPKPLGRWSTSPSSTSTSR